MFVSAALVYSFITFTQLYISHSRIGRTSRFNYLSFGSTHAFTIMCNSHENFPHHIILGQGLKVSRQKLAQMLLFFYVLHSVRFKKLFPMVGIVVEYGHCVCPISLHLCNVYLIPLELAGLECDPHQVTIKLLPRNFLNQRARCLCGYLPGCTYNLPCILRWRVVLC